MAFDWSISWYPSLSLCLCMIGWWLHIESFDMFICDACLVIIVHWKCSHVDYDDWSFCHDYPAHFNIYVHIVIYLVRLDMLILFVVYYLDPFLVCYSYYISILLSYSFSKFCVNMTDILMSCVIAWCMTAIFLCDVCTTCLCGTHI